MFALFADCRFVCACVGLLRCCCLRFLSLYLWLVLLLLCMVVSLLSVVRYVHSSSTFGYYYDGLSLCVCMFLIFRVVVVVYLFSICFRGWLY